MAGTITVDDPRRARREPSGRRMVLVAAVLAAVLVAALLLADARQEPLDVDVRSSVPGPEGLSLSSVLEADAAKLGVGRLRLDQPVSDAVTLLGPPASTEDDMFGTAYRWALPGGGTLVVSAWDDGAREINGLFATAPAADGVQVSTFGGVMVGLSSLHTVIDVWGEGFTPAVSVDDDYVVSYVECVGPYPVVVKFDQESAVAADFPVRNDSALLERPVTSVLIAYADAAPGTSGCSG